MDKNADSILKEPEVGRKRQIHNHNRYGGSKGFTYLRILTLKNLLLSLPSNVIQSLEKKNPDSFPRDLSKVLRKSREY